MKNKRSTQNYGIYLAPDFCRDTSLNPTARIVLGQICQYAKSVSKACIASNDRLAKDCGVSANTVTNSIAALQTQGWITVTKGRGGRRSITLRATDTASPQNEGSPESPVTSGLENSPICMNGPTDACEPASQNLGGDLNRENENRMKKKEFSSSFHGTGAIPCSDNIAGCSDIFMEWATQVCSLIKPRTWERRGQGNELQQVRLHQLRPGKTSTQDMGAIIALAQERWPRHDLGQSVRQLLRSAAWTIESRNKLQQYCHLLGSLVLNAHCILRLGGRDTPLDFINECASVSQDPSPALKSGGSDDHTMIIRPYVCSETETAWDQDCWIPCWNEHYRRFVIHDGAPLQMSIGCALYKREKSEKGGTPLPWLADSLTESDFTDYLPLYKQDRINAWTKGTTRPPLDPDIVPPPYKTAIGCLTARAAAGGHLELLKSKRCLECAARDIMVTPELAMHVPEWEGDSDSLVRRLLDLAKVIRDDVPPFRSESCGNKCKGSSTMQSFIRCAYGVSRGDDITLREHYEIAPLLAMRAHDITSRRRNPG